MGARLATQRERADAVPAPDVMDAPDWRLTTSMAHEAQRSACDRTTASAVSPLGFLVATTWQTPAKGDPLRLSPGGADIGDARAITSSDTQAGQMGLAGPASGRG